MGELCWTDASNNLWMFGGQGYAASGLDAELLNDLWEFVPGTTFNVDGSFPGNWIWRGGSNSFNQSGVYGTLGAAAAGNIPGGRWAARQHGIHGCNREKYIPLLAAKALILTEAEEGLLNDLWKYNFVNSGLWTWVCPAQTPLQPERCLRHERAQVRQLTFLVAARPLFFGPMQPAISGSLAVSVLIPAGTGTHSKERFSMTCGNSRVASGFGYPAAILRIGQAPMALKQPRQQKCSLAPAGEPWVRTDASKNLWLLRLAKDTVPQWRNRPGFLNDIWEYQSSSGRVDLVEGHEQRQAPEAAPISPTAYRL